MRPLHPDWFYDEMKQVGIDFNLEEQIIRFDEENKFRNIDEEVEFFRKSLNIKPEHTVLEYGIRTGLLTIALAPFCKKIIALDTSINMLATAESKAIGLGISNIEFIHAGFLTYKENLGKIDSIINQITLHHLPDFWKQIAILNMYAMLKPGGRLCIKDTFFSFDVKNYEKFFDEYLKNIGETAGLSRKDHFAINIKEEYPTFDWIIKKMLKDAGFIVEREEKFDGYFSAFICKKPDK